MRNLIFIFSLFRLPAPFYGAPTPANRIIIPDMPLPEAIQAIQATVHSASRQGSIDIDDLQRLLDIIANHVERMREATHGGNSSSSRTTTTIHSKARALDGGGQEGGGGSYHHYDGSGNTVDVNYQAPTEDEHGGLVNITCKGISVCNPVTVYNGKGGKNLGKIHKDADKAAKKGDKAGKKGWWRLGRSGRWTD